MKKKIVGIFVIMLMISSAMTTIIFSNNINVEASGGGQQSNQNIGLDFDFVWNMTDNFSKVIYRTDWSNENNIPKGRCWATAGENYTIDEILEPNMNGTNKPCGLTGYTKLPIGYVSGERGSEPNHPTKPKQYSSKIVIKDYNLTIHNGGVTQYIPYSELFPFGVGHVPFWQEENQYLNQKFDFSNATIRVKSLGNGELLKDHHNVSCDLLNAYDYVVGQVVYLNTTDPVPENHDCVFILNEESASVEKLEDLSDAMGCILIEDSTHAYTFGDSSQYNFAIAKLDGTESNFSIVLSEIKNGSVYAVDNIQNNEVLVFSNYSNASCCPPPCHVNIVQLSKEGDYPWLTYYSRIWNLNPYCVGAIISNYQDQEGAHIHVMGHTVRDWKWFGPGYYTDRYALPIFSVDRDLGSYIITNKESVTVDGFILQEYRQQTNTTPGVISHNVVSYRNTTHSPNDAIVVLSNRIDGQWGETPGDSGVGGAILLGIAKYFKDNNITPKYDLTFLFTTGEEYGMRGAQHYVDSHPKGTDENEYNFKYWIGFDQLGFNYTLSNEKHCLHLNTNNKIPGTNAILKAISQQTNYQERIEHRYTFKTEKKVGDASEDYVWNQNNNVTTIFFEKDNKWDGHHQTGENYQLGDSLDNIDRDDVNLTFELAWNVTKYFTVNPDCSFVTIDQPWLKDSSDQNQIPDSVQINYTINSSLPSDHVMVKAILYANATTAHPGYPLRFRYYGYNNYTITPAEVTDHINISIKSDAPYGDYTLKVYLYNSTGVIDNAVNGDILDLGKYANEKHTYHVRFMGPCNDPPNKPTILTGPSGKLRVGTSYPFTASTTDPNGDPVYYQWKWQPDTDTSNSHLASSNCWFGPFPSGEIHSTMYTWYTAGAFDVQVRARDIHGACSEWSNSYHIGDMSTNCDINTKSKVLNGQAITCKMVNYQTIKPIQSYTWILDYIPGEGGQEGSYAYVENPSYTYTETGVKYQNLTIKNALGEEYSCNNTLQVLNVISNFTVNHTEAKPNSLIQFTNTSLACSNHSINNVTWDFGDQTYAYTQNPTHTYTSSGAYNVTLTVKHGLTDTDTSWQIIQIDTTPPDIFDVTYSPYFLVPGSNITLYADFFENGSGIDQVKVNITTPENTTGNYTMTLSDDGFYSHQYTFTNTWIPGYYNFTIWVKDKTGNMNHTNMYWFKVSDSSPDDGTTNISTTPTLTVHMDDPNEDAANVSFYQYFPNSYVIDSENDWKAGTVTNSRTDGSGHLILVNDTTLYGTGANGDYTVTSSITLTGNESFRNLTINTGKTLNTAGYTVKVLGKLLNYGTITDSTTGGAGGSYGAGCYGQIPEHDGISIAYPDDGPAYPDAGWSGTNGSAGSLSTSGLGGRGGAGGGGGGGAWTVYAVANGGDGGDGGVGGKGGGTVKIYAFKLDNHGVIQANGSVGGNGASGTAGGHQDFYHAGNRDISGGGGGGGGGGNGGNGGTVNITYGVLLNQGKIYAAGGAKGTKGSYGNRQYNTYGINFGVEGNGTSGGSGDGAGGGGAGGKGEYSVGYSDNGVNGNDGVAGESGITILHHVLNYVTAGSYYRILNAGSVVEWADPVITATISANASVVVTYGENTTGVWRYYEDITLLPACRWLKVRVNLTTNNITLTPSVDKVKLSTRTLLHTDMNVSHDTNATYQWSGRSLNTVYYWQARIYNLIGSAYGTVWDFRTTS